VIHESGAKRAGGNILFPDGAGVGLFEGGRVGGLEPVVERRVPFVPRETPHLPGGIMRERGPLICGHLWREKRTALSGSLSSAGGRNLAVRQDGAHLSGWCAQWKESSEVQRRSVGMVSHSGRRL